jgi:DNA polymerase III delta prime subunit
LADRDQGETALISLAYSARNCFSVSYPKIDQENARVRHSSGPVHLVEKRGTAEIEERMVGNVFGKPRCILIDEVDGMTAKAQMALRNLLDVSSVPVSWLFTANEVDQIHKALWSRVIVIDCSYSQPDRREAHVKAIIKRCKHILRSEKIRNAEDNVIREIVELQYPDLRQTILSLQMKLGYANKAA